jgi:two-component system, LytTR family, response regulator
MSASLNLLIIEDNPIDTIIVRHLLKVVAPNIEICADVTNIEQAITAIETHKPDIILSDIELADGSVFEVFKRLHEKNVHIGEIIFMSSTEYFEYAVKAIDHACLAYISKPLSENILRQALEKAQNKHTQQIQIEEIVAHAQKNSKKLIIPVAHNGKEIVESNTINYFEAMGQCTVVHLVGGAQITAFRILGYFKDLFANDHNFFLVHQSFLVNVNQVKSFQAKNRKVILKNDTIIEASRRCGSNFKNLWNVSNQNLSPDK